MIGEINRNNKIQSAKSTYNEENYLSSEGKNGFSSDENFNSKHKLLNLKEENKKFTKSAIVRIEFRTRYNSSKKVNFKKKFI